MRQQKGCISIDRGSWSLRWRETDANGKRVMRFKSYRAANPQELKKWESKKAVPADIQQWQAAILAPLSTAPVSLKYTIGDLMDKDYLPFIEKSKKPSTQKLYRGIWTKHLQQHLSRVAVRDFQRSDAFRLWERIHSGNPEMSRSNLANIRFFLSGAFEFALNRGMYSGENPCKADLPGGLKPRKEGKAYNMAEVGLMLSLLRANLKAQAVVAMAFGTGLRKGELSGLDWTDYEATDSGATLHVRRSNWRGRITAPKTESSSNDVKISQVFCDYVEAYRTSIGKVTSGFMFGVSAKKPLAMDAFATHHIKPILEAAKIEWRGWHSFRRGAITFAATQLNQGLSADGIEAGRILGRHSTSGVTLEHYIKATKQEKTIAAAGRQLRVDRQRDLTAEILGHGLEQVRPN